ncbi:MAG: Crp/Fnr family transcriptional regulator [Muribaculaceae bacterium]|nr:Crp/Fnr family transcriptional regulator [Muribaculaceae bacterium]
MTYLNYTDTDFYLAIKQLLLDNGKKVELSRGDLLCQAGDIATKLGLLVCGTLKYSITATNGRDRIVSFAFTGDLVGSYSSMRQHSPSLLNIVATESSVVYQLPVEQIDAAIGLELRMKLGEALCYQLLKSIVDNYCLSPEERYVALTCRFPDIHNRMTNRIIASYLGITPESLSRMRKRLLTRQP